MGKLTEHPNFEMPEPIGTGLEQIVEYALETAARLVSPPKVDGEDEELACEDVASQIRGLKEKICLKVEEPPPPPPLRWGLLFEMPKLRCLKSSKK